MYTSICKCVLSHDVYTVESSHWGIFVPQTGLVESITAIVKEYKEERGLLVSACSCVQCCSLHIL